jgi:hypothetical protein
MYRKIGIILFALNLFLLISSSALADLTLADGGASGQWFNASRDGEGIYVEIVAAGSGTQISAAWFTYDQNGDQMWLVGNKSINQTQTIVTFPVFVLDGPVFGPNYDPDDVNRVEWGTLTLSFPSCNDALLTYASTTGFGTDTIPQIRLTTLEQVTCNEPPLSPQITPGLWTGPGVCFNVALDGLTITQVGSACDLEKAVDIQGIPGETPVEENCNVDAECSGVIAIVNGSFDCFSEVNNERVVGSFTSENNASGMAQESAAFDSVCTGAWTATPAN